MERKAILEDYLNDERFTRDYYASGDDKNSKSALEEVMDEDHVDDIYDYFAESDTDSLEDALQELGAECSEVQMMILL